uniref:DUF4760 domain-containing protein n=1 Tax=viral metagenome TaxID=1070528 RepID=A0A6C0JW14_9ZZZZ
MILVTPLVVIVVFTIAVIIAAIATYRYKNHQEYQGSRMHVFASALGTCAILLTVILYFNLVQIHNRQSNLEYHKEMVELDRNIVTDLHNEMKKAAKFIPIFITSINPLESKKCKQYIIDNCKEGKDEDTPVNAVWKRSIAYCIFNAWQDAIMGGIAIKKNCRTYIIRFLQMANSDQLKEEWEKDKIARPEPVRKFGDMLFRRSKEIEDSTDPLEYNRIAGEIVKCPKYCKLQKSAGKLSLR